MDNQKKYTLLLVQTGSFLRTFDSYDEAVRVARDMVRRGPSIKIQILAPVCIVSADVSTSVVEIN